MFMFFQRTLKVLVAIDLHFINQQKPWFQLQIFNDILKKKFTCISERVSKLPANFHFCMKYSKYFKSKSQMSDRQILVIYLWSFLLSIAEMCHHTPT